MSWIFTRIERQTGMKRDYQEEQNAVTLPGDLLYPLAWQLDLEDSGTVFRFLLLCRTARQALQPVLAQWYKDVEHVIATNASSNDRESPIGRLITAFRRIHDVTSVWPRLLEPEKSPDVVLCLYYINHCKSLVDSAQWWMNAYNDKPMECHCTVEEDEHSGTLFWEKSKHQIDYYGHVHWQALNLRFKKVLSTYRRVSTL